ncbi:MAG: 4'-phosphopantetheinyl transferase superfamily protein [Gemmatimonadaceae bacterium]|nr:4'-phosphopantetheinyl transferase superfamily protein [Gemmatimonadaceae bacterium]
MDARADRLEEAPFAVRERRLVAHGHLVVLDGPPLDHWTDDRLHAALGRALAASDHADALPMGPPRRAAFLSGRHALRVALAEVAPPLRDVPLPRDSAGAPVLPPGVIGSISHKGVRAVALADRRRAHVRYDALGVDVEAFIPRAPTAPDIARKVLTDAERAAVASLEGAMRDRAVLVRFSLKEALYKAVAPLAGRWIGFQEAEIHMTDDGRAIIEHRIAEVHDAGLALETWWEVDGERVLTSVRATSRE